MVEMICLISKNTGANFNLKKGKEKSVPVLAMTNQSKEES